MINSLYNPFLKFSLKLVEVLMITTKILDSESLIEDACALLYKVYIEHMQWNFDVNNPSKLRVEVKSGRKLLVDNFTNKATWFGAFIKDQLIGCIRICGTDENNRFEVERYNNSEPVRDYLTQKNSCVELTKLAVESKYNGQGVARKILLAAFRYCDKHDLSVFTCTHNAYLKYFYGQIEFPLKVEHAFKYEEQDPMPVNFYYASHEKDEVNDIVGNLKYLTKLSTKKFNILELLDIVAPVLPVPVYWHDINGVVLGINEHCLKAIGTSREIIGKTPYEFYPKEIAEHILKHNEQIIRSGEILSQEEQIADITTGKQKYFAAIKAPLYDHDGQVIGIVGTSIEITAEKEAELLRLENKAHKAAAKEQERAREIAKQAAHDIQSPLSTLRNTVQFTSSMEEHERIAVRTAINSITATAYSWLNAYANSNTSTDMQPQDILVSATLHGIIANKRYEYKDLAIEFDLDVKLNSNFVFIRIEPNDFGRMLSNLINNSVDALVDKKSGLKRVNVKLNSSNEWVIISIEDNGKGIPEQLIQDIKHNKHKSFGKNSGHGVGWQQISATLQRNLGKFDIHSTLGESTKVIFKYPKITPPSWIAQEIKIIKDDIVVVVDDDTSIHVAWDSKLKSVIEKLPTVKIKHFSDGQDAINFINDLNSKQKPQVCLLTDYELINQKLNGLDIIEQTMVKRAILVTSHYADSKIRERASALRAKVLPKELVFAVSIILDKKIKPNSKKVDMVLVDDNIAWAESLINNHYKNLKVDKYAEPVEFLENIVQYPLDTKIILDMYYDDIGTYNINGFDIAKKLHELGYNKLYMAAGEQIKGLIPDYLTVIYKDDTISLSQLDKL